MTLSKSWSERGGSGRDCMAERGLTLGAEVIVADPGFAPMYASRNKKAAEPGCLILRNKMNADTGP